MLEWIEGMAGPEYAEALLWTLAALVAFALILGVTKIIRGMMFGTYVAGGRNRKTRLAVMDATPVDSHRRLVLVRRDDVEHLLLIGGPTDVVVEQDIRLHAGIRRPEAAPTDGAPRARPPERPAAATPRPGPVQQPTRQRDAVVDARAGQPRPTPVVAPRPPQAANTGLAPQQRPVALVQKPPVPAIREAAVHDPIEDELEKELEVSFELPEPPPQPRPQQGVQRSAVQPPISLDDEMTKLLGELSSHKKIG